jgi:branched-chain amino acid transport system ATP-binding protein
MAVDIDHLEVQRHDITGLIGPNGAGKTTLFNLISGFDTPDSGSWLLDDEPLAGLTPHRIAQAGVVRTFQLTRSLARLTVVDNACLGATHQRGERFWTAVVKPAWSTQEEEIRERALQMLDRFGLGHMADEYAGTLSGGQRKLLEMARAMMTEPEVLLLDEPVAGVNPALTQHLLEHIIALRDRGTSIVFVEHDMDVVAEISDWVVCMATGSVIAEGNHDQIASNDQVISAYLGTERAEADDAARRDQDEGLSGEEGGLDG